MSGYLKRLLAVLTLVALSCSAQAFQTYETVGEGRMRWLMFQLYEARLLSPDGSYDKSKLPIALELTYQRDIKSADLVSATQREWQRMKVDYSSQWIAQLGGFWPDVGQGDVLLFHVDESAVGRFYYNGQFIGSLNDEAFSTAFLSIWLSEDARNQSLKDQLVGIKK